MNELEEQFRRAAPKPTGQLDTAEIGRRADRLNRRRTARRVIGVGAAAAVVVLVGALWVEGRDGQRAIIGEPVDVADDPVEPARATSASVPVDVSLVTTTYVAEGSYRCESGEAFTSVASTVVTHTWSDPENERWASRTEFDSGPVDQLVFGIPAYPTQAFRRGEFPEPQAPCTPGHPAGQVVNIVEGGGSGGAVRGVPILSEDQERALEGLRITYRDFGVEAGAGVDSLGRAAVIWESDYVGGYTEWGDEQVPLEQRQQWFVDPETGRVLEETQSNSYGDYGQIRSTTTYSDPTMVTIDDEQFDPAGYSDESDGWLYRRYPTYVATPSPDVISIGVEWIWPAEPRPIEAADLVAAFSAEVLDTSDAVIERDLAGLPGTFDVAVGELAMSIRTAEVPGGLVVVDVASDGFNGSQGVNTFVAPGAVLSVEVPLVASSYTVVVADAGGPSTWMVDGIEVTSVVSTTTTLSPDGITVVEDNVAKASITIPGMTYADADRVLVIGRDDDTLLHVAANFSIGR